MQPEFRNLGESCSKLEPRTKMKSVACLIPSPFYLVIDLEVSNTGFAKALRIRICPSWSYLISSMSADRLLQHLRLIFNSGAELTDLESWNEQRVFFNLMPFF